MGWHIDSSQKLGIRNYTSDVLMKWHRYWIKDMEFSTNLLKQFVEDLNEDFDSIKTALDPENSPRNSQNNYRDNINHALSIMQVFNTVLSCIKRQPHEGKTTLDEESTYWFDTVMRGLLIVTGNSAEKKPDYETETYHDVAEEFEEDLLLTGLQSTLLLIEMAPNVHLTTENDQCVMTMYVAKHVELSKLLHDILHNFVNFSNQGQVCILQYCFQMQSFATESGSQEQNLEEKIVQQIVSSGIVLNAIFSGSAKVSFKQY